MTPKKLILLSVLLIIGLFRLVLIFMYFQQKPIPIDATHMGYLSLLHNPIVHLLFCITLIIMLCCFLYVVAMLHAQGFSTITNKHLILVLIAGLISIATAILCFNWNYIHDQFTTLISVLWYEAYNPTSAPNQGYFQWKYSLNPAKIIVGILLFPLLFPLFYYLRKVRQNKNL